MKTRNPKAMNTIVAMYIIHLIENDPDELSEIIQDYRSQNEGKNDDELADGFPLYVKKIVIKEVGHLFGYKPSKKLKRKTECDTTDYSERANNLLLQSAEALVEISNFAEISTENLLYLSHMLEKIHLFQQSKMKRTEQQKARIICAKCQTFLAECELKKKMKKKKLESFSPFLMQPIKSPAKRIKNPDTVSEDGILEKLATQSKKVSMLPKRRKENLLQALDVVGDDSEVQAQLVQHKALRHILKNNSDFMQAIRMGDEYPIRQLLGLKPELVVQVEEFERDWNKFRLPSEMSVKLVARQYANQPALLKAVEGMGAEFSFVESEKIRTILNSLSGNSLFVIIRQQILHKISILVEKKLDYDRYIIIDQANPSTICREIALACMAKGIGFFV